MILKMSNSFLIFSLILFQLINNKNNKNNKNKKKSTKSIVDNKNNKNIYTYIEKLHIDKIYDSRVFAKL